MSDIESIDDAWLVAGGWVEFDLGVLEYTRLQRLASAGPAVAVREIILRHLNSSDPDRVELRRAAQEIIDAVPAGSVLSARAAAVITECRAALAD